MVDILLVEDNRELSEMMSKLLEKAGYSVFPAMCVEEAEVIIHREEVRLVILDTTMPTMDEAALCRKISKRGNVPVIIIIACIDKEATLDGYNLGADDYVEKPIDMDLLCGKIAALFDRYYNISEEETIIRSGAIEINKEKMEVRCNGRKISMTAKEYALLLLFVANPGKNLSKEYLFGKIWGADYDENSQILPVHIKMLRSKFEDDPKKPRRINTVWGVGYRYEEI